MKLINLLLVASLTVSLQAQTVRGNYIKNLPSSIKSIDNGGTLTAAQAHTDGIGVIIVDEALDNSAYNTLANKYAAGATKLIEHVLLTPDVSAADKALALSLLADIPDGTSCDDGNALTFGETYLIGVCQGGVANGSSCDDSNFLTFGETYLSGVCQGGVINGDVCDDKNSLTSGDIYVNGVCVGTLISAGPENCYGAPIGSTTTLGSLVVDFALLANLIENIPLNANTKICTSNITNMGALFSNTTIPSGYDDFLNIKNWDTSHVTNMYQVFTNESNFNVDISAWNTSNVTDMRYMFHGASTFNQNISGWCVRNFTSKPLNFDYNSGFIDQTALQPQWGNCPTL